MENDLMLSVYLLFDIIIAYLLDLILGDPYWFPHPVKFIGCLVKFLEGCLRKMAKKSTAGEKGAGIVLALSTVLITFFIVFGILYAALLINTVLFHVINICFLYTSLAAKCLAQEALGVYSYLEKGDIEGARKRLSMLVGRDTSGLSESEVIKAVVETTSENTTDGIVSPLFYIFLGSIISIGAPLVYAFKAVSTLDSMVGYKNERYINIGFASARLDDAANYIPARLTGFLIPIGAVLCGHSFRRSLSIMLRDRRKHNSPNSAHSEAAVAGALGISLGGKATYFGKLVEKPVIGDSVREPDKEDIVRTVRIMYAASALAMLTGVLLWSIFLVS
jgi:adenosylcobinamide-phosphate synthase